VSDESLPRLRTRLTVLYAVAIAVLGAGLAAVVVLPFWSGGHTEPVGGTGKASSGDVGVLVFGLVVVALVAVLLGRWVAGRAVRPLEQLAYAARTAHPERLPGRGEPGWYREFADLSATLSTLYARLDAAYSAQRRFVADASHELRTPLAVQRTLIQVGLAEGEVRDELLRVNDQQERLVAALLALAQGQQSARAHDTVDLAAVAADALASRLALTTGLRVDADLRAAVVADADPTLLASLVGNLVDNAIRYNVDGGRIAVRTDQGVLTVANTGPVVPAEAVERIQQPFQRLATGRTDSSERSGLGLAIVRAIADSHQAALRIRPQADGGLHIDVIFPGACGSGHG
jgi:signal transduction histidine kinase